jgi:hypothetical protein
MQIFGVDLLPCPEHLDHLKVDGEHFPARSWPCGTIPRAPGRAGVDGRGGIRRDRVQRAPHVARRPRDVASITAAEAPQRLSRMKILIYGNLLPIHEPLRLTEESCSCSSTRAPCPREMFMNQIRRFSAEVMPELRRHIVTRVVAV